MVNNMNLRCIRNSSKSLPYAVGGVYRAENLGGILKVFDAQGGHILAPAFGHYVEFEIIP